MCESRKVIVSFEIPRILQSGNWLKRGKKQHWVRKKYAKYKEGFLHDMQILALPEIAKFTKEEITKRRDVRFIRCIPKGDKRFDDDNLTEGFKPVRDCLTMLNIIRDDSPKWIDPYYFQQDWKISGMGEKGGVIIIVWE